MTLPAAIRAEFGLASGDFLEARIEHGKITLEPKAILPRGVLEGIADFKSGDFHGPFEARKAITWLKKEAQAKITRR